MPSPVCSYLTVKTQIKTEVFCEFNCLKSRPDIEYPGDFFGNRCTNVCDAD